MLVFSFFWMNIVAVVLLRRSPSNPLAKVGGTLGQALWHCMQAPEDWSCLAALVQGRGGFGFPFWALFDDVVWQFCASFFA